MNLILLIIILLILFGGGYGWHAGWGYGPHTIGLGGVLLIVLIILLLTGRL